MSGGNGQGSQPSGNQGAGGAPPGLFGVAPGPNMFNIGQQQAQTWNQPQPIMGQQQTGSMGTSYTSGQSPWMGGYQPPGGTSYAAPSSSWMGGAPQQPAPTAPTAAPQQAAPAGYAAWDSSTHYTPGQMVSMNGNNYRATDYQGPTGWNENAQPGYGDDKGGVGAGWGIEEHKMWDQVPQQQQQQAPVQSAPQPRTGNFAGVAPQSWQFTGLAKGGLAELPIRRKRA